jgi:hypothetical protein
MPSVRHPSTRDFADEELSQFIRIFVAVELRDLTALLPTRLELLFRHRHIDVFCNVGDREDIGFGPLVSRYPLRRIQSQEGVACVPICVAVKPF